MKPKRTLASLIATVIFPYLLIADIILLMIEKGTRMRAPRSIVFSLVLALVLCLLVWVGLCVVPSSSELESTHPRAYPDSTFNVSLELSLAVSWYRLGATLASTLLMLATTVVLMLVKFLIICCYNPIFVLLFCLFWLGFI